MMPRLITNPIITDIEFIETTEETYVYRSTTSMPKYTWIDKEGRKHKMNNSDSFFKTIRDQDALSRQPYIMFQDNDLTKEPRIVYVVPYEESYLYESTLTGEYIGCAEDEQVYKIPNYKYPNKA